MQDSPFPIVIKHKKIKTIPLASISIKSINENISLSILPKPKHFVLRILKKLILNTIFLI